MEPINLSDVHGFVSQRLLGIEAASEALAKGIAAGRQKGRGLAGLRFFGRWITYKRPGKRLP